MFSGARKKNRSDNRYELIEVIGEGGMGVVWKAFDRNLGGHVALKTLLDTFDKTAFKHFQEEVKKLVALPHHPNIISIMDVGEIEHDGQRMPFFSMPLLTGATLAERLKSSPNELTMDRLVDIACQTCRGLQVAHEHGLVHRDIKPSNIFVLNDFSVQIIDFGVAHRTNVSARTVGRKGTLHYMSPEQAQGKPLTIASDFFSLGVVCYEALSGRRPFEGETEEEVAEKIHYHSPPPLHGFRGVSVALSQAVHKALAKLPSNRYLTAPEFSEHLQKALRISEGELFSLPRPRLDLAREKYQKGDYDFARKLLATLQAEGMIHPEISELDDEVDAAVRLRKIAQGIEQTRSLMDVGDYNEAGKHIRDVLTQDSSNTEALALERQIDGRRADVDVEELLRQARECMNAFAFDRARQTLDRVKKRRPKEPRVGLFASEITRLEDEYREIQHEKHRHFAAALSALQRKDISSAFSHAQRLQELDKQRPEIPDARRAEYQSICSQVQTERETIENVLLEASRDIDAGNLNEALALCQRQLEKYPTHEHLLHLQFRIEELQRHALTARIGEIDRLLKTESDINKRIRILEGVLKDYPGESHFERQLQQMRNLCNVIEGIVAKGAAHKERKEYAEAQQEWQKLKTIYPAYPALELELEQIARLKAEHERRQIQARLVEQVDGNLEAHEFGEALALIRRAPSEVQSQPEISALERIAIQGIRAKEQAQEFLTIGRNHSKERRYDEGLKFLRQAHDLDRTDTGIASSLLEGLVEHAQILLDTDPKVAEASLQEALDIDSDHSAARGLLQIIKDRRQHQVVDGYIAQALELQTQGNLREAMSVLNQGLRECPNDPRILQRQSSIRKQLDDERLKDRDSARRLVREAESIADPPTLREYSGRLGKIAQRHLDDPELQETVRPFYRRLHTIVDESEPLGPQDGKKPVEVPGGPLESDQGDKLGKRRRKFSIPSMGAIETAISRLPVWSVVLAAALLTSLIVWGVTGLVILSRQSAKSSPSVTVSRPVTTVPKPPPPPAPPQAQNLQISGFSAYVMLDQDTNNRKLLAPGEDFHSELEDGEHRVDVFVTPTQKLSFALHVQPGEPASLTALQAQNLPVVIVTSKGAQGRIYASPGLTLRLNGDSLGSVNEAGRDLPALEGDRQTLVVNIGNSTVSKDLVFPPVRAVVVFLKPDPSQGGLLVKSSQDGVQLVLSDAKGKAFSGSTRSGGYQFSNLRPGVYALAATKEGFISAQETITVVAAKDLTMDLALSPMPTSATVMIRTKPGATIAIVGGKELGAASVQEGALTAQELPAGNMAFEVRSPGYRSVRKSIELKLGDNGTIEIPITERVPGTLKIKRSPENSSVTYQINGDSTPHNLGSDSTELPEGTYTLRAQANGFEPRTQSITIRAGEQTEVVDLALAPIIAAGATPAPETKLTPMTSWDEKTWNKEAGGSRIHKAKGVALVGMTPGTIMFTASPVGNIVKAISGGSRLQWVVGYKSGDYLTCVIDGGQYISYLVKDGKPNPHGKATLKKQNRYKIEVTVTASEVTVKVYEGGQWRTIEDSSDVPAGVLEGQFGFQDQVRVYDFSSSQ